LEQLSCTSLALGAAQLHFARQARDLAAAGVVGLVAGLAAEGAALAGVDLVGAAAGHAVAAWQTTAAPAWHAPPLQLSP